MKTPPIFQIIAGPNGSGKSTFARFFLLGEGLLEFLNADLLAAGLSPMNPQLHALRAGRLLLERWDELAASKKSFSVESTLSGLTYVSRIQVLKKMGYKIRIAYLWLPTVNISLHRIRQRVIKGGHHVPEMDVRRRFLSGLKNFHQLYLPLADEALIFDASSKPPVLVAIFKEGQLTLKKKEIYDRIQKKWL